MTTANPSPVHPQSSLRERAKTLLQTQGAGLGVAKDASAALRVLFDLAASPTTAHDALALLHELQVHQVELDLQNEELLSSRAELEAACDRQMQLRDASPGAQLVLDEKGCVIEGNALAELHLNASGPTLVGKAFVGWLAVGDAPRIQAWLTESMIRPEATSLAWTLRAPGREGRAVIAAARANPLAPGVLLAWVVAPTV
jgi:PAS domain-containing protein